jgi:hypothetical protein
MELDEIKAILQLIPNNCPVSLSDIEQIYNELKEKKGDESP